VCVCVYARVCVCVCACVCVHVCVCACVTYRRYSVLIYCRLAIHPARCCVARSARAVRQCDRALTGPTPDADPAGGSHSSPRDALRCLYFEWQSELGIAVDDCLLHGVSPVLLLEVSPWASELSLSPSLDALFLFRSRVAERSLTLPASAPVACCHLRACFNDAFRVGCHISEPSTPNLRACSIPRS
jgi:hypothetical protein